MSESRCNSELEELKTLFANYKATTDEQPLKWIQPIRDKLFVMLQNPLKDDYRSEVFRWIAHLTMTFGDLNWINIEDEWTPERIKMFLCVVKLSMGEIQIILPLVQRHLRDGDAVELEDGKVVSRPANSEDYDQFGNFLVILEGAVKTLVKNQELDESPPGTKKQLPDIISISELSSLLSELKSTMDTILEYLELVNRQIKTIPSTRDDVKFLCAEAALRITCVWLSEDPSSFHDQCNRYLFSLLLKYLLMDHRSSENDIIILALHSVCTSYPGLKRKLHSMADCQQALDKYLTFVQSEKSVEKTSAAGQKRQDKKYKLRCGLIKDLISEIDL